MQKSIKSEVKRLTRRIAWVGCQLLWKQAIPVLVGTVSKSVSDMLKVSVIPETDSPFIVGHLLSEKTVDGALMAGVLPSRAWAKYATRKGLPTSGKVLAVENEPHSADDFDGEIKAGYGKGMKTLLLSDVVVVKVGGKQSVQKINYHVHDAERAGRHYDIVVTGIKPGTKQWEVNIPRGDYKGRYAFVRTNQGTMIVRMSDQGVRLPKPDYTLRKEDLLAGVDTSTHIVERKIDGSLGNAHIQQHRVAFRSHRDGGETYYDKVPAIEFIENRSPFLASRLLYRGPEISGTILQGEISHPEGAARVSGILNSLAPNARAIQKERGPVSFHVWDISKYRGRDVSHKPYHERRAICEKLVADIRRVNPNWHIVEKLEGHETPKEFYDRVTRDPLPWGEGVVIKARDGMEQKWDKMKMVGFGYFKLHDILPGEGKYEGTVGRLVVENPVTGARGEVGSLSVPDEYRDWIWANRADLRGQTIKVRSQEVTARGVPRAGVFYGFHNSEVGLMMAAEAAVAGTGRDPHEVVYAMKSAAGWRRK